MKVLVTGGAGFLGGHLVARLAAAGHQPVAYDMAGPSPEVLAVAPMLEHCVIKGRIDDLDTFLEACRREGVDAIVHAAARVGIVESVADPVGFYRTNVMGTVHACEAARALRMRKLVYVSSNAAYYGGSGDKLRETDPQFSIYRANPAAHYGTSKLAGEAIGMAYADYHEIDFLALRVTAIYGFGMNAPVLIKPLVENAVLGKPTRLSGGGRSKRDYTHVADCCEAILRALEGPKRPPGAARIVNAASGSLYSGFELADIVRRVIPGADIELGSHLSPVEEANVKLRAALDVSLAKELLDWSPQWPIEAGIAEYAARFRDYVEHRR